MDYADLVAAADPAALREALAENAAELRHAGAEHEHGLTSVRTARHQGHRIVVRTTYEITIDGQPFDASLVVDNAGRVFYHGLPTQDFASTVDLVKQVVDTFPDFAEDEPDGPDEPAEPDDGGHDHDDHGPGH